MDSAAKVLVLIGSTVAGAAALLLSAEMRQAASLSQPAPRSQAPWRVDLSGHEPISVECVKKPLPVFSVYQY